MPTRGVKESAQPKGDPRVKIAQCAVEARLRGRIAEHGAAEEGHQANDMGLPISSGGDLGGFAVQAGADALHGQFGIGGGQMHQCRGLHVGHRPVFGGVGDL